MLGMRQTRRSSGVARDDDELDPALHQPRADLLDESVHFGKAARTIRTTRGITDVDDGFPGQRLRDFARYGKPAEP